jgi:hypothetical protein
MNLLKRRNEMRKLFLMAIALMLVGSQAFATGIQTAVEPKSGGPIVWTESVYNASNTDFDAGDVVVWTIGDSTGDNDLWVTTNTTTTAAANNLVAGVVYPVAIASGDIGSIAVWGIGIPVDVTATVTAAGDDICKSGTAGSAAACVATDAGIYSSIGTCLDTPASSSCNALLTIR